MQNQAKRNIKIVILSIFFFCILIFIFFNSKNIIFGIKIKNVNINNSPAIKYMKTDEIVKITGRAKNAINIKINGREISIDQKGNFDETLALSLGYNLINIIAKDKFGNVDEKNYQLIY